MKPRLVQQAQALAAARRFERSCSDPVGRLLHVLASSIRDGVVGEIGTGVGAAWLASTLDPTVPFVTVEIDPERAAEAARLFAHHPNVTVIHSDWHEILRHGPFTLLFPDGAQAKTKEPETVLSAVRPGGMIVLDDLTPGRPIAGDPQREFWLRSPGVIATEIQVSEDEAVILAVRR